METFSKKCNELLHKLSENDISYKEASDSLNMFYQRSRRNTFDTTDATADDDDGDDDDDGNEDEEFNGRLLETYLDVLMRFQDMAAER